jgi:hypothetical protein
MKLNLRLWWRRPRDPKKLGIEAIKIAAGVLRFSDGPDVGKITNPIREGFADNFAGEKGGPHGSPWALLAERTSYERVLLGFDPYHPILERTGRYKSSWIDRTSGDHFERQHKHGQFSGTKLVGQNKVTINFGSTDYRVPTLEGGEGSMPAHLLEREQMLGGSPFGGEVPPRPVRFVSDDHIFMSKLAVAFLLSEKIRDVKGPK